MQQSCCRGFWLVRPTQPLHLPLPPQAIAATKAAGRRLAQARPADELTHMMVPEENPRERWDCESVLSIRWAPPGLQLPAGVQQLLLQLRPWAAGRLAQERAPLSAVAGRRRKLAAAGPATPAAAPRAPC